jgi:hypothetical protein
MCQREIEQGEEEQGGRAGGRDLIGLLQLVHAAEGEANLMVGGRQCWHEPLHRLVPFKRLSQAPTRSPTRPRERAQRARERERGRERERERERERAREREGEGEGERGRGREREREGEREREREREMTLSEGL